MFEDAPVNATGDAVSTNKPIVRKKKKKDDSGYREIGTPELLKRYIEDTPGQEMFEAKKDMTAISSWKKKLKNVKGLSKDTLQQLSMLPTPVITSLINQIGMIVSGDELEEKGLWDNIRAKRARGEKMRKKGEKGAPTQDQIKRAQGEELGKNADAGDYIDDFRKSDAPQFKGKSDEKIRKMAIAAFLSKKKR